MSCDSNAIMKKIRTEYMKKFRDPKWETFSKCYQDSLKYRLTRRLMEQTHRPLFGEGWDSGSDSSGTSSPRPQPQSNQHASSSESRYDSEAVQQPRGAQLNGEGHVDPTQDSPPVVNGFQDAADNGPSKLLVRPRHRTPRSEPTFPRRNHDTDESTDGAPRKPSRAKSQPPGSAREKNSRRESTRLWYIHNDWTEKNIETRERRRPNMRGSVSAGEIHRSDVGIQTRRDSEKRGKASDRRRARSADLEKLRRSESTTGEDRWMTEYMRCYSARLR